MRISDWSSDVCSSDLLTDIDGVVWSGRPQMNPVIARYAVETDARRLADVVAGADVFLGVSAPGVLTAAMVQSMAARPVILALANPTPEIMPELVHEARPDAIIATGRSEEHTSELQSLMRISYAVFCFKKKKTQH